MTLPDPPALTLPDLHFRILTSSLGVDAGLDPGGKGLGGWIAYSVQNIRTSIPRSHCQPL